MISRRVCLVVLLCVSATANAWTYSRVITVSALSKPKTYQHLESSGNRSLAVGPQAVAVTWEDNRSGRPQVYIAFKPDTKASFTPAQRLSRDTVPAYEPAVVALHDGRFVVAWEAQSHIWARIVTPTQAGPIQRLSTDVARQVTISLLHRDQVFFAWSARAGHYFHVVVSSARIKGGQLRLSRVRAVDPAPPTQDQQFPSLARSADGLTVAWEDRRYGHTRIFTAFAPPGKWFGRFRPLNELRRARQDVVGNGTGAMRVVLASDGAHKLIASWLDKRDFAEGYDVYAAISHDGGQHFGANEKVQDMFGANQAQWHAVCAMDTRGHSVAAWDDQRNGNPDVWMSWRRADGWSDDESPKGTGGAGAQSHPAIAFDQGGRLHLAFLEQDEHRSRIRYLVARTQAGDFVAPR